MGKPQAPAPPDPRDTSAAQTGTNISTALMNAFMGNVNQVTPYGNLDYSQTGQSSFTDPYTGQTYEIPQFTATQTLSPEQQALFDTGQGTSQNLADLAQNQSAFLQDYMGTPVDLSSENISSYINTHFDDDFNTRWGKSQSALENQLSQKGIGLGSEAYKRAMNEFHTSKAGAYDNMYGNQYGLAQQSIMGERNQPLNEIIALMSGSQIQQPSYVNANTPNIPTTDNAGLINTNYNQRFNNWQQNTANSGGLWGSLLGTAGSLGGAAILSDKRTKKDIKPLGKVDEHKVYAFRYKDEPSTAKPSVGVMAQEVEKKRPDAVREGPDGYKRVNYGALFGTAA